MRGDIQRRPSTRQNIAASTTTAKATNAVGDQTNMVHVFNGAAAGIICWVYFGLTGDTATATNGFPIAAQTGEYLAITRGQFVHVLLASSTGTVYITEMTN